MPNPWTKDDLQNLAQYQGRAYGLIDAEPVYQQASHSGETEAAPNPFSFARAQVEAHAETTKAAPVEAAAPFTRVNAPGEGRCITQED